MKFRSGYVAGWTQEERLFALSLFKHMDRAKVTKFTDHERRMFRRLIARLMGENLYRYPLIVEQECRYCERKMKYIERHELLCKWKRDQERRLPKPDLSILEMI